MSWMDTQTDGQHENNIPHQNKFAGGIKKEKKKEKKKKRERERDIVQCQYDSLLYSRQLYPSDQ